MRYTAFFLVFLNSAFVAGQLAEQSKLTVSDRDKSFHLRLEHLAQDFRAFGLSPRDIVWSPDSKSVYFRWRQDPVSGQVPETDLFYVVDAEGTSLRFVTEDEVHRIPANNIDWSISRNLAAWTRDGTLFVWTPDKGTRAVFTNSEELGNLRVQPNGDWVQFSTKGFSKRLYSRTDFENEDQGDLWVFDVVTGHVRQIAVVVTEEKNLSSQAKWLKEQQRELIDVVRQRDDNENLENKWARIREPFRPQEIPIVKFARAFQLQLSPDGKLITFLWEQKPQEQKNTSYMEFVELTGHATQRFDRPKVGAELPVYKMGFLTIDPKKAREDIEITWLEDGIDKETIVHGPIWNPQGTHAAVQVLSMDHKERWISLIDFSSGKLKHLDHQQERTWIGGPLVEGRWSPGFLEWLHDGKAFGFGSVATGWAMLYLAGIDGNVERLTNGDWEVRRADLSHDGSTWYLTTSREHPGEEQFYHLPARGGELKRVTSREGKVQATPSPDGRLVALRYESTKLLPDLYLSKNIPTNEWIRITKSGTDDFYRYDWISSDIVNYLDPAGNTAWARIWQQPKNANKAAVVYAHGCGECAQAVDKGWTRVGSILYANYLYQNGYTSASVDYRGSSGYGHANRTYAYRQMGISDIDSALPLLDLLVERGVDRDKIGVYGGSYGGFFTLMSLFRHPGKYRAGVALYPVTDWAHYNQGYTSRILNGSQLEDPEAYRRSSPIYYADGLSDALQIQHGLVDGNVQVQDSFRLAQVLIEKKKNFDLVVYPMEDHGWDEVATRLDSYLQMTRWFELHLRGIEFAP